MLTVGTIYQFMVQNSYLNWNMHLRINRLSRRERGMASNPLFIISDFFCIFPMNFAMATLGLKKMGKFLQTYGSHSWVHLERKTWYSILGVDAMPLSLKNLLLRNNCSNKKYGSNLIFLGWKVIMSMEQTCHQAFIWKDCFISLKMSIFNRQLFISSL